jgi:DNA helicase II / ATP-dependent DNA helicase PcrA
LLRVEDLSPEKQKLLGTGGPLLVLGGPGSGKTTVALFKADREIKDKVVAGGQRIIFLSFARSTIARVAEHAGKIIGCDEGGLLDTDTYHGFAWKLIRSHGYLLYGGGKIKVLPPPQAAARLAHIPEGQRDVEKRRLLTEERLLHFDLFASVAADLLTRSRSLRRIVCRAYPIIILDEFQDTNADEWALVRALGTDSRLIALADAEQRIYEFRGADPRRIDDFKNAFVPTVFDFAKENHRSDGRDIASFGDDLLTGANRGRTYKDVTVERYRFSKGKSAIFPLKLMAWRRISALHKASPGEWSLAVLVPTKALMSQVSDYLDSNKDELKPLRHDVLLDAEGPALAAVLIAILLQGGSAAELGTKLIAELCQHILGRRGNDAPPQGDLTLVGALGEFVKSGSVRGARRKRIVEGALTIAAQRENLVLSGNPEEDWLTVRRLFGGSGIKEYEQIADDARYLRLLHKGAVLRGRLSELWRAHGAYLGAPEEIANALLQEHFLARVKEWRYVHLMTLHKAKGKEFSEVLVFDGGYHRLVWPDWPDNRKAQALRALRVGVTRAERRTTILTPANAPCEFL